MDKEQILLERQREAKVVRKIVFITVSVILLIFAGIVTGGYLYVKNALEPRDPQDHREIEVKIPIGSGVGTIADILEKKKVIKDATVFKYYVKLKNETGFQAGTYHLKPSMTFDEIIASLKTGKVYKDAVYKITIPEGTRLKDIVAIIDRETKYSKGEIEALVNDRTFIRQLMDEYPGSLTEEILQKNVKYPLEGYLFPATYTFDDENVPLENIIREMVKKTDDVLQKYLPDIEQKKMTVHQVLTLASLIEEEATKLSDRKLISSVFYNRMKIGMPLQTDPTVLYALGIHKDRVLYEDLKVDDPYNTYKHAGLPPGPIANAGTDSIEAALYPKHSDYYYFLATKTGEVLFSKTKEEHDEKYNTHIAGQK